jgi:hypothetical protein
VFLIRNILVAEPDPRTRIKNFGFGYKPWTTVFKIIVINGEIVDQNRFKAFQINFYVFSSLIKKKFCSFSEEVEKRS